MAATLIGLSTPTSRAQTDEEVAALLAEALSLPEWQTMASVTPGAGFDDNVFLASANPQSAPFFSTAGEFMWFRLAPTGPRFNFFANAEARFFYDNVSYQEYTAFSQAQLEQDFNDALTGSLGAQYYYQNQITDVSVTETNRSPVPVLGNTIGLRPGLRLRLAGLHWLALDAPMTRQFYAPPLDDYREAGFKLAFGRDYGWNSQVSLAFEPVWRGYINDPGLTATGEPIPGTHRAWLQHNVRFVWKQNWDEQKHWRTATTLGGQFNRENYGGYSDYNRWSVAERLTWRVRQWEFSVEARFADYGYLNQTVSDTNPALRRLTQWSFVVNVERRLTQKVSLVANFDHERSGSNDPLETYSANTTSASVRWEF